VDTAEGTVEFEQRDIRSMGARQLRAARRHMQMIFQDPAGSLNPRLRVGASVGEPLIVHGIVTDRRELARRVGTLLERCGMPAASADRYPHEFSGGQRQRLAIARALALEPRLLICDEPTSALDVSIQAQILNLLTDLQRELKLSYLFISHDMNVIQHICHRVAVLLKGKIVEIGTRDAVLQTPQHEYTQRLLSAVPVPDPARRKTPAIAG
jgi:ABC-type microcin C transport system duplicated ATPase subunit YejF